MVTYFRNGTPGTLFGNANTASLYFGKGTSNTYFPSSPYTYFGGFDASAVAIFNAMTTPPTQARKVLINNLVVSLKNAGVWNSLDVLYVLAAADSQAALLNWKAPGTFTATAVNSPTFTADRGYAGDGSTSYLNTNWNPATNGVNYTQDNAMIGAWANAGTDTASDGAMLLGGGVAPNYSFIVPYATASRLRGRVNAGATQNGTEAITTRLGLSTIERTSSTAQTVYRNGVTAGNLASQASVAVPSANVFICCTEANGVPLNFLNNRISTAFAGAALTAVGQSALYSALQTYMTAVGA